VTITIAPNEHGQVRVFHQESTADHASIFALLEDSLGAKIIVDRDVQIASDATLRDLGLAQFLMMGYGISEADIAPQMDMLNNLTGSFAIIRSGAFGPNGVTLKTDGDAKLVATYHEEGASPVPLTPLTSDSAEGSLTPKTKAPKSDARIGGMVATVVLLLMGLLVWLMIWIGG
jgi:hypothetical protein